MHTVAILPSLAIRAAASAAHPPADAKTSGQGAARVLIRLLDASACSRMHCVSHCELALLPLLETWSTASAKGLIISAPCCTVLAATLIAVWWPGVEQ